MLAVEHILQISSKVVHKRYYYYYDSVLVPSSGMQPPPATVSIALHDRLERWT
jgi:hypothetical protein